MRRTPLALACLLAACFVDPGDDGGEAASTAASEFLSDPTTGGPAPDCGDGVVDPGEGCDAGPANAPSAPCTPACQLATCGDGYVAVGEGCDDGNTAPGDGCSAACTLESCGDGVRQEDEQCDDGDADDSDACTSLCKPAACGDGFVQAGVEQCDDGNQVDGDGCGSDCRAATCGDGTLQPDEACDDGNRAPGDGCDAACQLEFLYVFVTAAEYTGELGGPVGADARCADEAAQHGLPGQYRAWLSAGDLSPVKQFVAEGPWMLPDRTTLVADDLDTLLDGDLLAPINMTAAGDPLDSENSCNTSPVWTGTEVGGEPSLDDCDGFTTSIGFMEGLVGNFQTTDLSWTEDCSQPCDQTARLYCFQQ
jgi:cysteine-rich repeat protein